MVQRDRNCLLAEQNVPVEFWRGSPIYHFRFIDEGTRLNLLWQNTLGGPFAVGSISDCSHWDGAEGDDYESACGIQDYTGVISKNKSEFLILNDEPLQTAVLRENDFPLIVRWQFATSEAKLIGAVNGVDLSSLVEVESVRFGPSSTDLLLFDSVDCHPVPTSGVRFTAPSEKLNVKTYKFSPSKDVATVLHWLIPE